MKLKFYLVYAIIAVFLNSCIVDHFGSKLEFVNLSNETIYLIKSPHKDFNKDYDEELAKIGQTDKYQNHIYTSSPNDTMYISMPGSGNAWESFINNECDDKKLRVYVLNIDTLQKYSWREITEKGYYTKRIELTVADLNKVNWQVKLQN